MIDTVAKSGIVSVVERFEGDRITGWALDLASPTSRLRLLLQDGGRTVAVTQTGLRRPDVNRALDRPGDPGFDIIVPHRLFDGGVHDLKVFAGTVELHASPRAGLRRALAPESIAADAPRFEGRVETLDAASATGWAVDLNAPERPVHVGVLVDGRIAAVATAALYRKRLRAVTPSGRHGFKIALPTRLMNGQFRELEVRILEGDFPLSRAGAAAAATFVPFPLIDVFGEEPRQPTHAAPAPAAALSPDINDGDGPAVSVIVLNRDGEPLLEDWFRSLRACLPVRRLEILLVDHASRDGSVALARAHASDLDLKIIERSGNHSFAQSNNLAAGQATGDLLFFVNNDIVFTHDCLSPLAERLQRDATVGIVGMRLLEPEWHAGGTRYRMHHCGIAFEPRAVDAAHGSASYMPVERDDTAGEVGAVLPVPAVTGAALLCRKRDFRALGGFDETYDYGLEDVDLCLRMTRDLGKQVVCDTAASAIHARGATRSGKAPGAATSLVHDKGQRRNAAHFAEQFSHALRRDVLRALVAGPTALRLTPLRVVFVVTDASRATFAGDFFTALELGSALRAQCGYEVLFARYTQRDFPGADVVVAMRHDFDATAIAGANPGVIVAAWVRNRVDEWLASPGIGAYQVALGSAQLACDELRAAGLNAVLLPIAANEARFSPEATAAERHAVVFTGNYWGEAREAIDLLDLDAAGGSLAIYGDGWAQHPQWAPYWRGALPYDELAPVYAGAKIVIDDSHPVTRRWNSLNSRVFDALAAGALVITNGRGGAAELFEGLLPSFTTGDELNALLRRYLRDEPARQALARELRGRVLGAHTYAHRAAAFRGVLRHLSEALRICIKTGVPRPGKTRWGDWYFAFGLKRALEKLGHVVRVELLEDWQDGAPGSDDVAIVLRGLSRYRPRPGTINLLWLISHPDRVTLEELREYDHVYVASRSYAKALAASLGDRVSALLQCTDPEVFFPDPAALPDLPKVLFVGNSRGVRRPIVEDAIAARLDLGVVGTGWQGLIPERYRIADWIANDTLRTYYSSGRLILNDHWDDMRRLGFLSNRLFDARACGATVVSDAVAGLRDEFGHGVHTYRSVADLAELAARLAAEPASGDAGAAEVARQHSFDRRAAVIHDYLTRRLPTLTCAASGPATGSAAGP